MTLFSFIIAKHKTSSMTTANSACVIVMGDLGRSPRMVNHALSIVNSLANYSVDLIGFRGMGTEFTPPRLGAARSCADRPSDPRAVHQHRGPGQASQPSSHPLPHLRADPDLDRDHDIVVSAPVQGAVAAILSYPGTAIGSNRGRTRRRSPRWRSASW